MFVTLSFDMNHFIEHLCGVPRTSVRAFVEIEIRAVLVKSLDIEVLDIGAVVCKTPRDVVVVADDDEGGTRERKPLRIKTRGAEMDFIPDRGNGELEVRVIGE